MTPPAVANGARFLNFIDVHTCDVLYLCLEDTESRMQDKIKKMQPDCPETGRIHFAFNWEFDSLTELADFLDANKQVKIVIIDTLSKFFPSFAKGGYIKQYQKIGELKTLADNRNIMIMLVHHLGKLKSDDPFEMLYGSNALAGVVDLVWILKRERGDDQGELIVSGRDVRDQTLQLTLDRTFLSWVAVDQIDIDVVRKEHKIIMDILGREMTLQEISIASGYKKPVLTKYLYALIMQGYVEKTGYGKYRAKKRTKKEKAWAQKAIDV